jgi:hypothetical protein
MTDEQKQESQPPAGNQSVQLGIGTLIIIALIVTMCSGRSEMEKVQKDTAALKQKLDVIDKKLDTLVTQGAAATSTNVEASAAPADASAATSPVP